MSNWCLVLRKHVSAQCLLGLIKSFEDQIRSRVGLGLFSCDDWGPVLALLVLRRNVQNYHDFHGVVSLTRPSTVCIGEDRQLSSLSPPHCYRQRRDRTSHGAALVGVEVSLYQYCLSVLCRHCGSRKTTLSENLGAVLATSIHNRAESLCVASGTEHSSFPLLYILSRAIRDHFRSSSDWIQSRFFYL